jgi:pimeloyl-ACP methyl ester carboxylesterase
MVEMRGLWRGFWLVAVLFLGVGPARPAAAQDFGKFLEQAGKELLKKQLSPENIERTLSPHLQGEPFPIQTADGWTLVAHRFRPTGQPRPDALPVILCHGLSYNAEFWTLESSVNFAEFLNQRGYDVWVVSLRGCGLSQKWVMNLEAAPTLAVGSLIRRASRGKLAPTGYATLDPKFSKWNVDDHIVYDVPAFVHLVRSQTRAPGVTWVGHSMGGIIALGHLARFQNPGIAKLVTIGSQMTMPDGQLAVQFLTEMIQTRQGMLAGQLIPEQLALDAKTSVDNMFFNQRNVSPDVYRRLTTSGVDVPSIGLLQQYLVMATKGELLDATKQYSYARNLQNVTVPILITCGATDQLAPPKVQQFLHDRVGSADKTMMVFGARNGFAADAGHNDSLVGLASRQTVYPYIESWISSR